MAIHTKLAGVTSILLRIFALNFLRFMPVPKQMPSIIFTLLAVYIPAFAASYAAKLASAVVEDTIEVVIGDEVLEVQDPTGSSSNPGEVVVAEKVDIIETISVKAPGPGAWLSLLSGLPCPASLTVTLTTLLINVGLALMTADFVFRARLLHPCDDLSFARLGYVSHTDARFLIREPDQSRMPITLETRVKDSQWLFNDSLWHAGGVITSTTMETDFTAAITTYFKSSAQKVYEWRTSNNHSGEFVSAPKPGSMPTRFNGKFTFLATSCMLPRYPYNPLGNPLSIPGLKHLGNLLPQLGAQFMLFLGDFIYVDLPLPFGFSVADYFIKYRHVYASPEWPSVAQNLSWIHVIDDHDIANDWSANTSGIYHSAKTAFDSYQLQANPPRARMAGFTLTSRPGATYFEFAQGPASFFLLDTRTYRSSNRLPDGPTAGKTMLGAEQLEDLIDWLGRAEPEGVKWKVVASSVPFTKNWPINANDTWAGFLTERSHILEAMWDAGARGFGVVVLSGDRHEFGATKFPPPSGGRWPDSAAVHEFSASPLNQLASPLGTYREIDSGDVLIKYIPAGRSKFGAVSMESIENGDRGLLTYTLYVNGKAAWNTTIKSPLITVSKETIKPQGFWKMLGF